MRIRLRSIVADIPAAITAERKIRSKLRLLDENEDEDIQKAPTRDTLEALQERERVRRRSIEDKARQNLMTITIGFTVVFAGIGFLTERTAALRVSTGWAVTIVLLLSLGLVYLVLAAVTSLRGYEVGEFHDIYLDDELSLPNEEQRAKLLIRAIRSNQFLTMIRGNYVSASSRCIRNGAIALCIGTLLLMVLTVSLGSDSRRGISQNTGKTAVVADTTAVRSETEIDVPSAVRSDSALTTDAKDGK